MNDTELAQKQAASFRATAQQMYRDARERFYERAAPLLLNAGEHARAQAWSILGAIGEISPDEGIAGLQRELSADPAPPVPASAGAAPLRTLVEKLKSRANDSVSHVGGSGGRYQCRFCLREHFPVMKNAAEPHWPDCSALLMRQAAHALDAALSGSGPSLPAPAWQPIATAPRDGTPILVSDGVRAAVWQIYNGKQQPQPLKAPRSNITATFWMPLPSPPASPPEEPR